jgi:peptidoglycan/LPS O-acetylase OafA/YrhL
MSSTRSFGLDLLRTFAIGFVLLAHFAKVFDSIGFWGVELFFALSGFLIGKIIWENYNSSNSYNMNLVTNFWKRRWWRTIPNYYMFLLVMIVFQLFWTKQFTSFETILKSIFFIQNFIGREEEFYSVSWSLCIEEWFYLLFPLVLLLLSFLGFSKKITFTITLFFFIIISIFIRYYLIEQHVGHSLRGITLARIDAIVYGVAASFIMNTKKNSKNLTNFMLVVGCILLFYCIKQVHFSNIKYEEIRSGQLFLMLTPLAFALIIPRVEKINFTFNRLSCLKVGIQNISLWSYSIYLSHIPVMFTIYYLTSAIRINGMGNLASKLIGLFITIMISAFIYKYFEKPLTNKRPKEIIN